jgi:hypothetical protein
MNKRIALPRFTAALTFAFVLALSSQLFAIQPTITARVVCEAGYFQITYTVTDGFGATNPSVNVKFDGVVVDNFAFTAPLQSVSDTLPAPAGKTTGDVVTVSFEVMGTWVWGADSAPGGQTGSTTVTLPENCLPVQLSGCTPGYWKQKQHFDSWVDPYDPDDLFDDLPGFANAFPGLTLLEVLGLNGGGLNALGRHTVAAILNSAGGFGLDLGDLADAFNEAVATGNYETLKNALEFFNEQGCPLD